VTTNDWYYLTDWFDSTVLTWIQQTASAWMLMIAREFLKALIGGCWSKPPCPFPYAYAGAKMFDITNIVCSGSITNAINFNTFKYLIDWLIDWLISALDVIKRALYQDRGNRRCTSSDDSGLGRALVVLTPSPTDISRWDLLHLRSDTKQMLKKQPKPNWKTHCYHEQFTRNDQSHRARKLHTSDKRCHDQAEWACCSLDFYACIKTVTNLDTNQTHTLTQVTDQSINQSMSNNQICNVR